MSLDFIDLLVHWTGMNLDSNSCILWVWNFAAEAIMKMMDHPNIIKLFESFEDHRSALNVLQKHTFKINFHDFFSDIF